MNSINSVTLVGNLTRDAELKYSNSGFAICNMSIAVNRSKKVNEEWIDEASFFDLVGLGKRFESLNQYLTRGSTIAIQAYAKQERWEKDGTKRSKVVFVIENIQLVGGKTGKSTPEQDYSPKTDPKHNGSFSDDIPF